jgi:lycopene beta-cyclase
VTKPIIIIGGGLWGGLLASALIQKNPSQEFRLYEEKDQFGGNHTWSFHETDVTPEGMKLLRPFIRKTWDEHQVIFPGLKRTLKGKYHSISSQLFDEKLRKTIPTERLITGRKISLQEAANEGSTVIDARGFFRQGECGYQKFIGLEVKTDGPHGLLNPILMDATVDQIDGFRFIYCLPYSPEKLLIEDTRYSQNSSLDHFRIKENIHEYARLKGWKIAEILREESGSLPIPYRYQEPEIDHDVINLSGIFHDTTGYSLPDAVRLVLKISESDLSHSKLQNIVHNYRNVRERDRKFFRFLNRLMFFASDDKSRYRMLEFFYKSSPSLMQKFYRGEMSSLDKTKFFVGVPPVSLPKAFNVILASFKEQKETLS